ncbi:MAG: ROK family protein [Bacilli bacterium]|nr:ROK family protein [Bacilli bacterium]MDD4076708.1 ROK family protein [Bacilli bacterium]MDD4388299.1 ROK family protein [Bacilli bacterium]
MYYICFDVGGTVTKYAVVNNRFEILTKSTFPTEIKAGADLLLKRMINKIKTADKIYSLAGVAVSSPGIVDCNRGMVTFANERAKQFEGIDYRKMIGEETGLSCWAENDANCFALAEVLHNDKDFLIVTVGTGIGGAIVIDGNVYHGINNSAGAFGQMRISKTAKWEEVASVRGLVEKAKILLPDINNGEELFALYDRGNQSAKKVIDKFYYYLALGLVNLAYIFSPPKIIIGGGITNRPSFYCELSAAVKAIAHPAYFGATKIEISKYKNDGGFVGALVHFLKM